MDKLDLIKNITENSYFADSTQVASRIIDLSQRGEKYVLTLDVSSVDKNEADRIYQQLIKEITPKIAPSEIIIILTAHKNAKAKNKDKNNEKIILPGVGKTIVIASGKGGVGKSSITALIATKLGSEGYKVGIIDADIYGPSMPHIFGLTGKPELLNNRMLPLKTRHNICVNSIGCITNPDEAISWRGPMVSKALYQLMSLTHWGEIDYLLIDTPPGTGDIHLSLIQNYVIDGAIIITTPQKISMIDVERSINLYSKLGVNIIGIIENMSGNSYGSFSGSAGGELSDKHQIDLLASIEFHPLLPRICDEGGDLGNIANQLLPQSWSQIL